MKFIVLLLCSLLSFSAHGKDEASLTADQLQKKVEEVTSAQNKVMMSNSTSEDVDDLFAYYTDDFTYVHEVYGGTYSRDELYGNTVRHLENGGYTLDKDRYTILRAIPGKDAIAVERRENTGAVHLSVFEFRGPKVKRIIEYWE